MSRAAGPPRGRRPRGARRTLPGPRRPRCCEPGAAAAHAAEQVGAAHWEAVVEALFGDVAGAAALLAHNLGVQL